MYVSRRIRRAIVLSVMTSGIVLLPSMCPLNINLTAPMISVVHAEIRTYTGTGKYIMSDFENQQIAQQRAIDRAI